MSRMLTGPTLWTMVCCVKVRCCAGAALMLNALAGLANNCLDVQNVCRGQLKLPGLWEIPMYAVFETDSTAGTGIHLMVRIR